MNVFGEMTVAQLENVTADPVTNLVAGRIAYRSDLGRAILYTGSAWKLVTDTIPETTFTIANNQVAAADVTGLISSFALYRSLVVDYDIYRKTATVGTETRTVGRMVSLYRTETAVWELQPFQEWGDGGHGVLFTVVGATGQIRYTSSNLAGATYVGKLNFVGRTFNA